VRIPGAVRLGEGLRRARSRFVRGGAILGYHRVAEPDGDAFRLCVSPVHFAEQLEVVRRIAQPVSLEDLTQAVWDRADLRAKVAITFDDGYSDNLHAAKPALEQFEIPATVHVVAGRLGRRFWWDELAARLSEPRTVLRAYHRLLHVPPDLRRRVIEEMPTRSGSGHSGTVPRALTAEELVELGRDGLVSIGAHSVTHPILTALKPHEQRREITEGKARLEDVLDRSVVAFAYPNGAASEETQQLVCEAGFLWASGSRVDVISRGSDPYWLPRLWVPDVNGDGFERWLSRWLGV